MCGAPKFTEHDFFKDWAFGDSSVFKQWPKSPQLLTRASLHWIAIQLEGVFDGGVGRALGATFW
jgi:hypothetical protein